MKKLAILGEEGWEAYAVTPNARTNSYVFWLKKYVV